MAAAWTDAAGRQWVFGLTVGGLRLLARLTGAGLNDLFPLRGGQLNAAPLLALLADPDRLTLAAWACLPPDDRAQISARDWGDLVTAPALPALRDCVFNSIIDFFPPAARAIARAARKEMQAADAATAQAVTAQLAATCGA